MSIKIEAPSETTRDAGGLSKDDEDFIAELRENSLLKKADEYVAMNAELEKKTSNILSEIEKYSVWSTIATKIRSNYLQDCLNLGEQE